MRALKNLTFYFINSCTHQYTELIYIIFMVRCISSEFRSTKRIPDQLPRSTTQYRDTGLGHS